MDLADTAPILLRSGDADGRDSISEPAGLDGEVFGPDLLVKAAHEIESLTAERAHVLVGELADTSDFNAFKLGGVLAKIHAEKWYASEGYSDFKSYVASRHGFKPRKAFYLVQIYNAIASLRLSWNELKPIGWTKLKEIAPVIDEGNAAEWLARAAMPGMTVSRLHGLVLACRDDLAGRLGRAPVDRTTIMSFTFTDEQLEVTASALARAKEAMGTDQDSVALQHIASGYLGAWDTDAEQHLKSIGLIEALSLLERCFPEADLKIEANRPPRNYPAIPGKDHPS
ncbi:MAG: hypothetical protein U1E60_00465 [Reyranellaceae bacterium]